MFGSWKIAEATLLERESKPAYHRKEMEVRAWKNKKKKGPGKRVALVILTQNGDIFPVDLNVKKVKNNEIIRYQIEVAKAYLQAIRDEEIPNWKSFYPYKKRTM